MAGTTVLQLHDSMLYLHKLIAYEMLCLYLKKLNCNWFTLMLLFALMPSLTLMTFTLSFWRETPKARAPLFWTKQPTTNQHTTNDRKNTTTIVPTARCRPAASILKVSKIAISRATDSDLSNTAMLFFYMKLMNSMFYKLLFFAQRLTTLAE